MIPLRIKLKGFMSYRDEQELSFEGEKLWMLAGHNGAGKSAVFDAMTYALYDQHRLGAQHADELINKESDELLVDFEFCCGDDTYRILRTLSRKGNRATRQVFHVKGPHAPNPAVGREQPVPSTEMAQGFKDWVRQSIGLDYNTFTSSVLLCQGKTDALLDADPRERHAILSQIVDLDRYERLRLMAEERRKQCQGESDLLQKQLSAIQPMTDAELATAEARVSTAAAEQNAAHGMQLRLAELKGEAKRWSQLTAEQAELRKALDATNALLAQATEIEQNAARLAMLQRVVPLLQALLDAQQRLRQNVKDIQARAEEIAQSEAQTREVEHVFSELTAEEEKLKRELADHTKASDDAQTELLALQPQLTLIAQIKEQRVQVARAEAQFQTYPADLDQRHDELSAQVSRLEEEAQALPRLEDLASAREQASRARNAIRAARERLAVIAEQIPAGVISQGVTSAALYAQHEQQVVATAQADLKHIEERLKRLLAVEGKPTCSYCGQPLTVEHIAAEHARVAVELAQARTVLDGAKAAHAEALKLKLQEDDAHQQLTEAEADANLARNSADSALKVLPASYRERALEVTGTGIASDQPHPYPSSRDLATLRDEGSRLGPARHELSALTKQIEQRNQQRAIHQQLATRLAEFELKCPPAVAGQTEAKEQDAKSRLQTAKDAIENLHRPLAEASQKVTAVSARRDELHNQHQLAITTHDALAARQQELERSVIEKLAMIPDDWRAVCESLTPEHISAWEAERDALDGADLRASELAEARSKREPREERLTSVIASMQTIVPEAQHPVTVIEEREREADKRYRATLAEYQAAANEVRALNDRRERRVHLESEAATSHRQEFLYGVLAKYLGRDYLQRHLLVQAEASIVERANRVLERISAGTLRLELRALDDGTKAGQKALDLVAYNELTADKPLLVGALSGSQRFRVAVSLALGIGEFASEGNQRIETVIIDEGFGSLDLQGRQDMIHELQNLKSELKRIILVSHQEEFTDAFTRGYYIELKRGTSHVSDLERKVLGLDAPDTLEFSDVDMASTSVVAQMSV